MDDVLRGGKLLAGLVRSLDILEWDIQFCINEVDTAMTDLADLRIGGRFCRERSLSRLASMIHEHLEGGDCCLIEDPIRDSIGLSDPLCGLPVKVNGGIYHLLFGANNEHEAIMKMVSLIEESWFFLLVFFHIEQGMVGMDEHTMVPLLLERPDLIETVALSVFDNENYLLIARPESYRTKQSPRRTA